MLFLQTEQTNDFDLLLRFWKWFKIKIYSSWRKDKHRELFA